MTVSYILKLKVNEQDLSALNCYVFFLNIYRPELSYSDSSELNCYPYFCNQGKMCYLRTHFEEKWSY